MKNAKPTLCNPCSPSTRHQDLNHSKNSLVKERKVKGHSKYLYHKGHFCLEPVEGL